MNDERTIAGRYRLLERVGNGAMGTVSRAFDQTLRRTVAVKEVHVPGGLTGQQNDELVRRTMREGRIAARLHHPRLITVYDVVEDSGRPYLIMEYFPSRSLKALGTLPWASAAWLGAQAAEALASAHASGVVHRDVKPANILVGDDGAVKITDFGVSRVVEDLTATMTGMFAGTPAYLAPEVAKGGQATFASDVYSLGATLYAVIEGTPPAGDSSNPMGLLYRVASGEINKPRHAGPLTDVVMWLLSADPAARPTMAQANKALSAHASKPTLPLPSATAAVPATEPVAIEAAVAAAATRVGVAAPIEPPGSEPDAAEPAEGEPAAETDSSSEAPESEWRSVPPVDEESEAGESDSSGTDGAVAAAAADAEEQSPADAATEVEAASAAEPDSATEHLEPAAEASPDPAPDAAPAASQADQPEAEPEAAGADVAAPAAVAGAGGPGVAGAGNAGADNAGAAAGAGVAAGVAAGAGVAPTRGGPGPAGSSPPPRKRSRARVIAVAAGLVVVAVIAAVVTTLLTKDDDPGQKPVAQPETTSSTATTTEEDEAPENTTTAAPTTTTTTTPPANTTQNQPPPQQPASPAAAISDYYGLVPGNLDEAWNRLTARFQNGHAGGRGGFANWWNKISSVEVSGVTETGANTVEATVLYHFKDGHSTEERHRYTLVNSGGTWLIDAQAVISSRNV